MNHKKYLLILYIIVATIILTIAIQVYWNYKNYQINTQRFKSEVQISLDNAVENYYANLAKENNFAISLLPSKPTEDSDAMVNHIITNFVDTLFHNIIKDSNAQVKESIEFTETHPYKTKSNLANNSTTFIEFAKPEDSIILFRGEKKMDSLKLLRGITSIYISINEDTLDFEKLNPLLKNELGRKNISIPFSLAHYRNNTVANSFLTSSIGNTSFKTLAKSTYLKGNEKLEMQFPNASKIILKRGLVGILLSSILALTIISSLFYLLNIIKKQKALAEIKNDLISNITHEFKTPITTVSTAIEAMNSFNILNDTAKTKEYLSISGNQLTKLSRMVEKLLETAILDSDKLILQKEPIDIVWLIEECVKKQAFVNKEKEISFSSNVKELLIGIDAFHFENAIANLIDNAIKYGGNSIEISINTVLESLEIKIADNNINGIDKNQRDKIFDKFYRIPKGNTHDVKGFGIGLYYTKKIIEKHGGTISLEANNKNTVFKINMPT